MDLQGSGVALVTPFTEEGAIDFRALEKLVNHVIEGGVEYLVALGTTGESVTLSHEEKEAVVSAVISAAGKRVPVVRGVGGNNTHQLVEELRNGSFEGVSAILSVSPYYNKPTQEGIYRHYRALSEASPLPLILYNVPGRTGSNVLPETTLRLATEFKNIIAVKEASGSLEQIMKIVQDKPADFKVLSGDDPLTLPIIAAGGVGVISVVANAFPRVFSDMVRACLKGDFITARKLHYKLLHVTGLLFAEGNPGGIKAALKVLGITGDHMRLPLYNVSDSTFKAIDKATRTLS